MATKTRPLKGIRQNGRKPSGVGKILSPQSVRKIERRFQVVTMRREGYTVEEISNALGCSLGSIRTDIQTVLNNTIAVASETVEESRQLQLERLDGILKFHYPLAKDGNLASAQVVLQVEARRSKLLALDVPEVRQIQVSGIREYVGVDVSQV